MGVSVGLLGLHHRATFVERVRRASGVDERYSSILCGQSTALSSAIVCDGTNITAARRASKHPERRPRAGVNDAPRNGEGDRDGREEWDNKLPGWRNSGRPVLGNQLRHQAACLSTMPEARYSRSSQLPHPASQEHVHADEDQGTFA